MTRVFIIAQSIAVRAGIRALLTNDQRIQVIGEAANLVDEEFRHADPDVILWVPAPISNQGSPIGEGMNLLPGETASLLLIHDDPKMVEKLTRMKTRAWGVISPDFSQAELLAAIYALDEGLIVADPVMIRYLPAGQGINQQENSDLVEPLTGRELEILQLLALGLTNKQIALRLGISAHTVKFHISSIFTKMGTTNRTETVKLGLTKGLIAL